MAVSTHYLTPTEHIYFLPLPFCARALAAAVFEFLLVRPSLSTLLAAVAAFALVCFALRDDMMFLLPLLETGLEQELDLMQ